MIEVDANIAKIQVMVEGGEEAGRSNDDQANGDEGAHRRRRGLRVGFQCVP